MTLQLEQMSLVLAISREIERQAKQQKQPVYVNPRHFNACVAAANSIVAAYATDDKPATPAMGLQAWLRSDDTGTSSLTMAAVLFNAGKYASSQRDWCHPWDPADFGRCHRFLEAVPEARARLPKMAEVSHEWKALVEHWDELTALYHEELPQKKAPKLYARMQALIEPARIL